jgi:hypothetical protein
MMGNIFNEDFRDFLKALNAQQVRYMFVGGYSVILHGYSRTTGDMDFWVKRTAENYSRIVLAFHQFGMPVFDMTQENFLHHPKWDVFSFGTPPVAIDLMVNMKGLDFDNSFARSVLFEEGDLKIRTIQKDDLIQAKKSTARPKDLDDLQNIQ